MPTDAFARASLRPMVRRMAVPLVLAALMASPALAQFSPRFRVQPALSVNIGEDAGKNAFVLADINNDRVLDIIAIEPDENRVDV